MNIDQEKLIFLKENKDIIDNIYKDYLKKTSKFIKNFRLKYLFLLVFYSAVFLSFSYIAIFLLSINIIYKLYFLKKYPRNYIIDIKNSEFYDLFGHRFMYNLNTNYIKSLSKEELNVLKKMQKYNLDIKINIFNDPLNSYTDYILYKMLKSDNNLIENELSLFNELNQRINKKISEKEYRENFDIINQIIINQKLCSKDNNMIKNNNVEENLDLSSLILNQIKF